MNVYYKSYLFKMILLSFLLIIITGCTHYAKIDDFPEATISSYPSINKLDLKATLYLSEEFTNYSPVLFAAPVKLELVLGQTLKNNAEVAMKNIFQDVTIAYEKSDIMKPKVDIVIEPKVVSMTWNRPMYVTSDMETVIFVEWSIIDKNGEYVWIDTVKGVGQGSLTDKIDQVNLAIKDLFMNTFSAISSSYEIKRFAENRR